MSRKMLIDATYPEETRVVVIDNNRVEEFDFETVSRQPIRGNIYLAKVVRVEPSLQAAFVEYGGNRHGFLAFNEIHPDYYQIPHEDREALREQEGQIAAEMAEKAGSDDDDNVLAPDEDDLIDEAFRHRRNFLRKYKIQEVIKRWQVLLVQAVKEERSSKGAALTTYLSLAGRYCVLMPNTGQGGGISRKITGASDRKRLKDAVSELAVPGGMGLIVRTAGAARTKAEIRRDYEYLIHLWEDIRQTTLESRAPKLVYEEGNLVKRVIRDLYDKDIDEVLVEGESAYKEVKDLMRMLMPSHVKRVQNYKDARPLFLRHQVESQLEAIHSPIAQLKSGGYIVINPTEALVSIDVNSGKATKERDIEQTALKTNMEAAEEIAHQIRLRDLAGLLVIDFIDMDENKNVRAVEKTMRDALKKDRARLQTSRISQFGLMEMSRQRRRTSLVEGSTDVCVHCQGRGYVRSVESSALVALRTLEEEGVRNRTSKIRLVCPLDVALYLLNDKRDHLTTIGARHDLDVRVTADDTLNRPACTLERLESRREAARAQAQAVRAEAPVTGESTVAVEESSEPREPPPVDGESDEMKEEGVKKRRRRGCRGGRNRHRHDKEAQAALSIVEAAQGETAPTDDQGNSDADVEGLQVIDPFGDALIAPEDNLAKPSCTPRPRKEMVNAWAKTLEKDAEAAVVDKTLAPAPAEVEETAVEKAPATPKRRRRRRTELGAGDMAHKARTPDTDSETGLEDKPGRRTHHKKAEIAKNTPAPPEAEATHAPTQDAPAQPEATDSDTENKSGRPRKSGWWQRSGKFFGLDRSEPRSAPED